MNSFLLFVNISPNKYICRNIIEDMKTEKEKMLAGELYLAIADELVNEREAAKEILYEYNNLRPSETEKRTELLKHFLGFTGQQLLIEQPFHCDYGYNIYVGENFYANMGCTILDEALVTFGDDVLLAPNVSIYTAGHPENVAQRTAGWEYAHPVTIGHKVWIGGNVVILPGVTIGDHSIIGAGSVVTKDIPANVIAAGNPCKVIRAIRNEE